MTDAVIEYFITAFKTIFFWILNQFVLLITPMFETIMEAFPNLITNLAGGADILTNINFFIPLSYGFVLLTAYLTIQVSFTGVGLVVKYFVPTLG